jgi:hypothetical protein
MRLTMVNGAPTFDRGAFSGRFLGDYIGFCPKGAGILTAAE